MKRVASLMVALALTLPAVVRAQVPAGMEQLKPYLQVKPVAGDEETVRVFFSPSCPFSRNYFQFFKNLEATLPKEKTFSFTPLVNKADGIQFALSYLAVQKYYPAYVHNFIEASFIGVQDKGMSTANWAGIDRIGRAAHVPVSVPELVQAHSGTLKESLQSLLVLQKSLEVTNTPAVSVAGTYIVTPEFTGGDAAMFSQLVNGIISMAR
jgi:protein-disulfide isomerase